MSEGRSKSMSVSSDDSNNPINWSSLSLTNSSAIRTVDYHKILLTFPISDNDAHLKNILLPFTTSRNNGEWLVAGKFILLCLETICSRSMSKKFSNLHITYSNAIHFEPEDKGQKISPFTASNAFQLINNYIKKADQDPKAMPRNALALGKLLFKRESTAIDSAYLPEWSDAVTQKNIKTYALPCNIILDHTILSTSFTTKNKYINIMASTCQSSSVSNSNNEEDVLMSSEPIPKSEYKHRDPRKSILSPDEAKNKTHETKRHQHIPAAPIAGLYGTFKSEMGIFKQPSDATKLQNSIFPHDYFYLAPPILQMQIGFLPTPGSGYYAAPSLKEYPGIKLISGYYFILPLPAFGFDLVLPAPKEQPKMPLNALLVRSGYCPEGYERAPSPLLHWLPLFQAPQLPTHGFGSPQLHSSSQPTSQKMSTQSSPAAALSTTPTFFSHNGVGTTQHLFPTPPNGFIPTVKKP